MRVLVTGGCGFIGSAVVRHLINDTDHEVINVDKMTYAATEGSVAEIADNERYHHLKIDICDGAAVEAAFLDHQPDAVMHLAAESHVDRSIDGPEQFLQTNVVGTMLLLQAPRNITATRTDGGVDFRLLLVSTDEVFGALAQGDEPFTESTPYSPSLAVLGLQGIRRSPRPSVGGDLRPPCADYQLLEQLWAVPLPRKADPARDTQGDRRTAATGLRNG